MKHEVATLGGALLDAAVAKAVNLNVPFRRPQPDRYGLVQIGVNEFVAFDEYERAMRFYVASKFGNEVELP